MQGRILGLDGSGVGGMIVGNDGLRYPFTMGEWRAADQPAAGAAVDFVIGEDATAREIFPLPGSPSGYVPPPSGAAPWGGQAAPQQQYAAAAMPPPQQQYGATYVPAQAAGGNSVLLGSLGLVCIVVSFVVPFLPTIAAFILGLVGANSGKRYNNTTGLVLSRISWIGALVLFIIGILFIGVFISFFALIFGISPADMANWSLV